MKLTHFPFVISFKYSKVKIEELYLTLQRLWQLSCCSALPLQCSGYHLLSWLVAEFYWCCPVSPLRVIRESVIESKIPKLSISPKWFIKRLHQFKTVDEFLAETALQTLGNYYWHLCGPVVLFALFSRLVSNEEKHNMAQKLLNFETPTSIKFGMLTFLEKSWRFFYCRIQILASCHCLYRNGRLMTSTEQFVKTLKCPWCCHAVTQCVCFTDIYLLIIYLAL